MFLFHTILSKPPDSYRLKLASMADYLNALMGSNRRFPFIGDDDGGRWFHPYGDRATFGRATLATCNTFFGCNRWPCEESDYWPQAYWWLNNAEQLAKQSNSVATSHPSQLFTNAGLAVLHAANNHVIFDAGPFGRGSAGHSHADTLSFTVTSGTEEILIDPGTFTYSGSIEARNWFRGTAGHNTVQINREDQAVPVNPFRWSGKPTVQVLRWQTSGEEDIVEAECCYRNFRHRRYLHFLKPFVVLVVDTITGPVGEHLLEQHWHLGSANAIDRFAFIDSAEVTSGWRSQCFSQRNEAPVLRVTKRTALPYLLPAAIRVQGQAGITITRDDKVCHFTVHLPSENKQFSVNYPDNLT